MIKGLILCIQFFTRIPININVEFSRRNIRYSIFFLPLIGALVGGFGGGIFYLLSTYSIPIASLLALFTTIVITGGLHLDGLADTLDGFLAGKNKEKTLEIMGDSRVGTFGITGLVFLILLKFLLIGSIRNIIIAMLLSFINSRLVVSYIISFKKTAKSEGLGSMFNQSNPKLFVIINLIIYGIILWVINIKYILPLVFVFILAQYISYIAYKKTGGLTGDVYGTIIELGDATSLLCFWGLTLWT